MVLIKDYIITLLVVVTASVVLVILSASYYYITFYNIILSALVIAWLSSFFLDAFYTYKHKDMIAKHESNPIIRRFKDKLSIGVTIVSVIEVTIILLFWSLSSNVGLVVALVMLAIIHLLAFFTSVRTVF
jgi:hypothetical protein